jgi:hypothetical protein
MYHVATEGHVFDSVLIRGSYHIDPISSSAKEYGGWKLNRKLPATRRSQEPTRFYFLPVMKRFRAQSITHLGAFFATLLLSLRNITLHEDRNTAKNYYHTKTRYSRHYKLLLPFIVPLCWLSMTLGGTSLDESCRQASHHGFLLEPPEVRYPALTLAVVRSRPGRAHARTYRRQWRHGERIDPLQLPGEGIILANRAQQLDIAAIPGSHQGIPGYPPVYARLVAMPSPVASGSPTRPSLKYGIARTHSGSPAR